MKILRCRQPRGYYAVAGAVVALLCAGSLHGQDNWGTPPELEGVDIIERLGEIAPGDITIVTDRGDTTTLGSLLHQGKPLVLNLAYYQCPMLCNLVLNGVSESMEQLKWDAGKEYSALVVSINPSESHELAASKKANYLEQFTKRSGREFDPAG
ncbi:MAG: SCO family protein, partial [Candidatus Zixiibacteriota bacterium]